MEVLLKKLSAYSRFLELEDGLPYWENQIPELEERLSEMKWNQNQKELELLRLQSPNFFQRIFGRAEEKKERIGSQIREIKAARTAAQWELESLQKKIETGKTELATLSGSGEAYRTAKASAVLTSARESRLMMEEISAFAPVAMETAGRILEALEDARPWMRHDAMTDRVGTGNRKMEHLGKAEQGASRLAELLSAMPEGCATVGSYLKHPHDYIYGVTSEFKQLDRLNSAQEQVRNVRNQLKLLLGE